MIKKSKIKYIVGIDEVGRGPLAGPVTIGAFKVEHDFDFESSFDFKIKDSKKLKESVREQIFLKLKKDKLNKKFDYVINSETSFSIDQKGLSFCLKEGIRKCLKKLKVKNTETLVLLDGGLKAPEEFVNQKTIIKGDEKEKVIALASIVAKVARDLEMKKMALEYPDYGFEKHKGYGTKMHYRMLKKHGQTEIHRKSFLKRLKK